MRATKQGTESNVAQQHVAKTRDNHTYGRESKEDIVGGDKARKQNGSESKMLRHGIDKKDKCNAEQNFQAPPELERPSLGHANTYPEGEHNGGEDGRAGRPPF